MRWKLSKVETNGHSVIPISSGGGGGSVIANSRQNNNHSSNGTNSGSTMTMDVKSEPQKGSSSAGPHHECAGCKKKITDRYMLKALDSFWHEDCLKCACCDCRLGEVGSTLFTKANLILCKRDYLRLFGTTGYCSACSKMIPAFEMVMRARGNVYHLECFACQQCNHRFCVGDRFYLCDNQILCEYDYEERMVFANMPFNLNSIAHIKRQTQNMSPNSHLQAALANASAAAAAAAAAQEEASSGIAAGAVCKDTMMTNGRAGGPGVVGEVGRVGVVPNGGGGGGGGGNGNGGGRVTNAKERRGVAAGAAGGGGREGGAG